jgi:hypothetical protein
LSCNSPLVVDPLGVGIGREKVFNLSLAGIKTAPADAASQTNATKHEEYNNNHNPKNNSRESDNLLYNPNRTGRYYELIVEDTDIHAESLQYLFLCPKPGR